MTFGTRELRKAVVLLIFFWSKNVIKKKDMKKKKNKFKLLIQFLVSHSISFFYSWIVVGFSYIPDSAYCGGKTSSQYWLSLGIIQLDFSLGKLTIKLFGTKQPFRSYLQLDFGTGTWAVFKREKNSGSAYSGNPQPLPFMRKKAKLHYSHII